MPTKRRMAKVALQQDREVFINLAQKGIYIIAIAVYTYCIMCDTVIVPCSRSVAISRLRACMAAIIIARTGT